MSASRPRRRSSSNRSGPSASRITSPIRTSSDAGPDGAPFRSRRWPARPRSVAAALVVAARHGDARQALQGQGDEPLVAELAGRGERLGVELLGACAVAQALRHEAEQGERQRLAGHQLGAPVDGQRVGRGLGGLLEPALRPTAPWLVR